MWNAFLRWWRGESGLTGYFQIGVPVEQRGPVQKTPSKQRFPFPYGKVILAMKLSATQAVPVSFLWKDKKGNPAKVENPVFLVSSSELLAIKNESHGETPGEGTESRCELWAVGPIGTVTVSLQGDADLGEGVKQVRFDGQIQIVGGQATAGELTFGTPFEQPDEPPVTPPEPPAGGGGETPPA